jgi:hemerythrin-like metal-binding protein
MSENLAGSGDTTNGV